MYPYFVLNLRETFPPFEIEFHAIAQDGLEFTRWPVLFPNLKKYILLPHLPECWGYPVKC